MLRKEDLDVIHDCTPNHMHYEVNSEILKAGRFSAPVVHIRLNKLAQITLTDPEGIFDALPAAFKGFIFYLNAGGAIIADGAEVAAGADPDPAMEEWCRKNGIARYYKDYKEMLRKDPVIPPSRRKRIMAPSSFSTGTFS